MPCRWLKLPDGTVAHMSVARGRTKKCWRCSRQSDFLCDFPIGKTLTGEVTTCDRPVCKTHVAHGVTPGVDFCGEHFGPAKANYELKQKEKESAGQV